MYYFQSSAIVGMNQMEQVVTMVQAVCTRCNLSFEMSTEYKGLDPICLQCRSVYQMPIILLRSIVPPDFEVIDMKTIGEEFKLPLTKFKQDIGTWDINDKRQVKFDIEPFDPIDPFDVRMIRKAFIARHLQDETSDDQEWNLVFERYDNICVCFQAYCSEPSFQCQSGGIVSYSDNFDIFWWECLDNDVRDLMIKEAANTKNTLEFVGYAGEWNY